METRQALNALGALAQAHRLGVFRLLVEHAPSGLTAGNIAEQLGLPPTSLSFHLKELSLAGLIVGRQDGRFIWYGANIAAMNDLVAYLTRNCCANSVVCDPACTPAAVSCSPVQVDLPAGPKRAARKRSGA